MDQSVPEHLPSKLESLPTELLGAILCASHSKVDLHALISASPTFYRAFSPAKRTVFLSILVRDLGPALRDALAVVTLAPDKIEHQRDEKETTRIIQQYKSLPRGDEALASATNDVFIALLHMNHSVQFLTDEFAASRFSEFEKIHPEAARPLTPTERWRFAQALLWHQFLSRITKGGDSPLESSNALHDFFGLFRSWEIHQLADVHSFICQMVERAFIYCRETTRPDRITVDSPPTELQRERAATYCDLGVLHRKVVSERARLAANPEIATAPWQRGWALQKEVYMRALARFNFLIAGPLPVSIGSDRVAERDRGIRDELYRREDTMPPLMHDENDDSSPPFGWVDAHAGINCQRWGVHLRREVLPADQAELTVRQRGWMVQSLNQWRWLGFAFWGRDRVELLKMRLLVFQTGWLTVAPPPAEECKVYTTPRVSRRRRRAPDAEASS